MPEQDIRIIFTGLRPGEKLFEELFEESERIEPTPHPKIQRAVRSHAPSAASVEQSVMRLEMVLSDGDDDALIRRLQEAVPSYQPIAVQNTQPTSH